MQERRIGPAHSPHREHINHLKIPPISDSHDRCVSSCVHSSIFSCPNAPMLTHTHLDCTGSCQVLYMMMVPASRMDSFRSLWGSTMAPLR